MTRLKFQYSSAALSGTEDHITHQVIEYRPNGGKGKAVRVGMLAATGERILFMDADYAVPIEALEAATAIIEERGVAIAIGSRAIEQAVVKEHQSFLRERMAKLFGFIQRNYLGLRLMDTQCGFKVFTREAAHRIFERVTLTSVIFDGEMLWLAKRMGYPVAEFPVEWTHDPDTRITYDPWRALRVLLDMLSIPFRHLGRSR